jgi:hypothetical protein
MTTITAHAEKIIARPIDIVRAQFSDMTHHATTPVHAGLEVADVQAGEDGCRFTGRRRVFGMLQEDQIELRWQPDGTLNLRSVQGSTEGLLIKQTFEAVGQDKTRVTTTVELPVKGLRKLLSPLVRMGLQKDVENALEEDRFDLEERGYPK